MSCSCRLGPLHCCSYGNGNAAAPPAPTTRRRKRPRHLNTGDVKDDGQKHCDHRSRLRRALVVAFVFMALSLRSMHKVRDQVIDAVVDSLRGDGNATSMIGGFDIDSVIMGTSDNYNYNATATSLAGNTNRHKNNPTSISISSPANVNIPKHHPPSSGQPPRNPFMEPLHPAPWDPVNAAGGHDLLLKSCQAKLQETNCRNKLPLFNCLMASSISSSHRSNNKNNNASSSSSTNTTSVLQSYSFEQIIQTTDWLSPQCTKIMDPCNISSSGSSRCLVEWMAFHIPALDEIEVRRAEDLLRRMHDAFRVAGVRYWMTAGSAIGGLYHHSRIPWDDDFDMYIEKKNIEKAMASIRMAKLGVRANENEMEKYPFYKVYDPARPSISIKRKAVHSYPFIDVFPVECTNKVCKERNGLVGSIEYAEDSIFPLKWRPFGRLSLPFPNNIVKFVEDRYGRDAGSKCIRHAYNHKAEIFRGRRNQFERNCSDLSLPPAQAASTQIFDGNGRQPIRPWPIDLPNVTVEHLMDVEARLSSVMFSNGDEVRRSYADGLMNVAGDAITFYSAGTSAPQPLLLPFLEVERRSYAENVAGRTAETLNLEIMPMLDTPEVGNNCVNDAEPTPGGPIRLRIGEWNAERGTNWDAFQDFFPNASIIILNEMDWGMARSRNVHTIRAMAESLQMNYAYGVEFMELTNGNKKEIESTVGEANLAGYHGNAVLSKWPVSDAKVLRLHPLYDKLYAKKAGGMDEGERRLGGRMALFATTHIGDEHILLISVHSHAGSPKNLFSDDARAVCKEIHRRNITNVLLGGDTGPPFTSTLVSECGFHPLEKTNKRSGRRFQPTWRVDCPDGESPRAKFSRGDWLLARGPNFPLVEKETTLSVFYPYKKLEGGKYNCISDHAMIAMETDFVPSLTIQPS